MAETPKLSVEKALQKLRSADAPKSRNARRDEEIDALDEEIKRMRAQRLRLEGTSSARPSGSEQERAPMLFPTASALLAGAILRLM